MIARRLNSNETRMNSNIMIKFKLIKKMFVNDNVAQSKLILQD